MAEVVMTDGGWEVFCDDKGDFSANHAYKIFLSDHEKIAWSSLFKANATTPKARFIVWMAMLTS